MSRRTVSTIVGFLAGLYIGTAVIIFFVLPEQRFDPAILGTKAPFTHRTVATAVLLWFGAVTALGAYLWATVRLIGDYVVKLDASREVNKSKDEFISMVLHHLRTPLSGMKWMLKELLKDRGLSGEVKQNLEKVDEENERALTAVNHLIQASQASMGRIAYHEEVITARDVIESAKKIAELMRPQIAAKNLGLSLVLPSSSSSYAVKADREKISIVLETLLENAILYTKPGGLITVKVYEQSEGIYCEVADTGIGIPRNNQSQIFNQFFRGDNAKELQQNGYGIGLFLARMFLRHMRGDIRFISEENRGSTFTVYLPVIKAPAEKLLESIA